VLVWAPPAGESAAAPTRAAAAPAVVERGLSASALQPPLDLAALQATADAVYTRTPGVRGTPDGPPAAAAGPVGTPAPSEKPGPSAAGKPGPTAPDAPKPTAPAVAATPGPAQPAARPGQSPTRPPSGLEPFDPLGNLEPEPTGSPTGTATATPTSTASPTSTATATATPIPSPCEIPIQVPRLGVGVGYFVAVRHESQGGMSATWRAPPGGRILFYAGRPAELPDGQAGVSEAFPSQPASLTGSSGGNPLNATERPADEYVLLFFNASAQPLGPSDASVVYLTHGHCP
jgi:hypothetical protein